MYAYANAYFKVSSNSAKLVASNYYKSSGRNIYNTSSQKQDLIEIKLFIN